MSKPVTEQEVKLVKELLQAFPKWCTAPHDPSTKELHEFFTDHYHLVSNGQEKATSLLANLERIRQFRKHYTNCRLAALKREPLLAGSHIVVEYELQFIETEGAEHHVQIMAIVSFDQGKVCRWEQVAHEKIAIDRWDSR